MKALDDRNLSWAGGRSVVILLGWSDLEEVAT